MTISYHLSTGKSGIMDCVWNNAVGFVPRILNVTCGIFSDMVRRKAHMECGKPGLLDPISC